MAGTIYAAGVFTEFTIELPPDAPPVILDGETVPADLPERFLTLIKHNPRIRALWERDPQIQFR